jgi:acyl-CoA synthetase (AMP-forming)/AMP-acid ligase II
MGQDEPLEFGNIGARLAEAVAQSKRYAITRVDSVGVIERFVSADVAGEVPLWAQLMREQGLEPGDRVLVLAGRAWEWRCALLGVLYAGGVAVPCPESTPVAELRAIAEHARATLFVSIPARPDLVEQDGAGVLSADQLDTVDAAKALAQPPHPSLPGDVGLILYARNATGLQGTVHTHASLIAQADAADHWLGIREGERVWGTAADGSAESIWLLLAAWGERANIVIVDLELDPEAQLELLERLHPAALWFSDEEYGELASAAASAQIDLESVRRALVSDESSAGATAFEEAFGTRVTPLFGLNELGVVAGWPAGAENDAVAGAVMPVPGVQLAIVDEHGTELPAGQVGDVVVRGDAPSLFSGYMGGRRQRQDSWLHLGWRGALGADHSLRLASRPPLESELVEAEVDLPGAELVEEGDLAAVAELPDETEVTGRRSKREAKRARREEERQAKEREKAEERRRREEEKSRELAERAAAKERGGRAKRREEKKARRREEQLAKERQKAEAAERAEREAAEAEERRRVEEEARAEQRRAEREKRGGRKRRREEKKARRREEQLAKERQKAEAAQRAEREAAEVEERRRAEEAARAEELRHAEDEKRRERDQRREEKEARRREEQEAKKAARAQRKAPRPGKRRREAAEQSEPERLSGEMVSRIKQYSLTAPPADPDERREAEAPSEPHAAAEPSERQESE